jgi:hypothetical protein
VGAPIRGHKEKALRCVGESDRTKNHPTLPTKVTAPGTRGERK